MSTTPQKSVFDQLVTNIPLRWEIWSYFKEESRRLHKEAMNHKPDGDWNFFCKLVGKHEQLIKTLEDLGFPNPPLDRISSPVKYIKQ